MADEGQVKASGVFLIPTGLEQKVKSRFVSLLPALKLAAERPGRHSIAFVFE